MFRKILYLLLSINLFIGYASDIYNQSNMFSLGIKSGIFIPQNSVIQGYSWIRYNASGLPTDISAEGFGTGPDSRVYFTYTNNNSGLAVMIEFGFISMISNRIDFALAPDGERESYENRMFIMPVTLSSLYKINLKEKKFILYTGFGFSLNLSEWESKHSYYITHEYHSDFAKGSSSPVGIHIINGFEYPLYHSITISFEFKYSFTQSNWEIKNEDSKEIIEYQNLNTGGCSLLIGIGYNF